MATDNMNSNSRLVRIAIATALASTALTGCTGKVAPSAAYSAAQAETALAKGKSGKAIELAETSVLANPRDAATRALLANAYLQGGRFLSAATTYAEAIELGDTGSRTVISMALSQIAMGDQAGALATLDQFHDTLDPADYGLALSLAGRPDAGVSVMNNALRGGQNTAKMRQNLAYAYALAGDWAAARVMAAEDVPADQIGDRLGEWASTARPEYFQTRIATLLGVTPAVDPGQPTMLALGNHNSVEQLAAEVNVDAAGELPAADAAESAFAFASELPPAAPFAEQESEHFAAAFDAGDASLADAGLGMVDTSPRYVSREVVQPIPAWAAAPVVARTASQSADTAPAVSKMAPGNFNVQLGSYYSMSDAQAAWKQFQKRYPELQGADKVITKARVNGKIYYRVAAAGFAEGSARSLCTKAKSKGAGCFAYSANSPLPGALREEVRVAAR